MDSGDSIARALPPHMRHPHPEPQPAGVAPAEPRQRSRSQPRSENWLPALPRPAQLPAPDMRQVSLPVSLARCQEPAPRPVFGPMRRSEQLASSTSRAADQRMEATRGSSPPPMRRQPEPALGLGRMRRSEELSGGMKGFAAEMQEGTCGLRRTGIQPALVDGAADQSRADPTHGEARKRDGRSATTASAEVGNRGRDHSAAGTVMTDSRHQPGSSRALPRIAEDGLRSPLRRYSPRSRSRSPRARAPTEQRAESSQAGARGRSAAGRSPRRRSPVRRSRCAGFGVCLQLQQSTISSLVCVGKQTRQWLN